MMAGSGCGIELRSAFYRSAIARLFASFGLCILGGETECPSIGQTSSVAFCHFSKSLRSEAKMALVSLHDHEGRS